MWHAKLMIEEICSIPGRYVSSPQLFPLCTLCAGMVDDVLPRRSELQDPAVANVDQVLLVFALERPPLDLRTATRFLVSTEAAELPVTVVLNKTDLVPPQECSQAIAEVGTALHDHRCRMLQAFVSTASR